MTVGALLYAFNSDINYTKIALECANRIREYLDIPVSIVTDQPLNNSTFDKEIIVSKPSAKNYKYWQDTDKTTLWHNAGRSGSLEVTPYERTLLVDIDYMINSTVLENLLTVHKVFLHTKMLCQ
jgi:hypothetical protein